MRRQDLYSRFAAAAAESPERIALWVMDPAAGDDHRGTPWSYAAIFTAAAAMADELVARGLRPGDRVAFHLANRWEFVAAYLAVLRAGAAMVPINLAYRRREIAHILTDAEPRFLFSSAEDRVHFDELAAGERGGAHWMAIEALGAVASAADSGVVWQEHLAVPLVPRGPDDLALLLYTSGTTGASKGAELSHGNVLAMIDSLHQAWEWSSQDVLRLVLPLFHLHGLVVGLHCALAAGATVRLERSFDAETAIDSLQRGEATIFFGVPTIYVRLVEALRRRTASGRAGPSERFAAVRLFVSGSAPLSPETHAAFAGLCGHQILERYGMTETGMLMGNPLRGRRLPGTVGLPLPGVEMRLADAAGDEVPRGAEGEVEVRGPNVFRGYFRAAEKTAQSFRLDASGRSWFRTGDLGRVDPETGYLSLLGRRSELIISGGFNIYPREIEEVLLLFAGVAEAAVVGEPHPEWGESPVAFVVAERRLEAAALAEHCRAQLASFKCPRRFFFVDALPRNALGKVEKRRLVIPPPDPRSERSVP